MSDIVLLEVSDRIATVTLNRPDVRNALSSAVLRLLPERLTEADARDDVDVIVLTGTDPAFCAGLDLSELASGGLLDGSGADGTQNAAGVRGPFPPLTKPLIGAVNGVAVTGGLELALNCDFLVASERAKFGDTHTRVGVMPGWGLSVLLPQAVGVRRAREMSFTGNFVDARTALAWGLVNHVVPHEELIPTVRALASDIAGNFQPGVRALRSTYAAVSAEADNWGIEGQRSGGMATGYLFDRSHVAQAKDAIIARGRGQ